MKKFIDIREPRNGPVIDERGLKGSNLKQREVDHELSSNKGQANKSIG